MIKPPRLSGCNNQPRTTAETSYPAQDGWTYSEDGTTRWPCIVKVKHKMRHECFYDKNLTDPGCTGCLNHHITVLVIAAICKALGVGDPDIKQDRTMSDQGVDSLDIVEIIIELEDALVITIPDSQWLGHTVKQFTDEVQKIHTACAKETA